MRGVVSAVIFFFLAFLHSLVAMPRPLGAGQPLEGQERKTRSLGSPYEMFDNFSPQEPFNPYDELLRFAPKRAAMGVDLPDYILHYNPGPGSSIRAKMQKSGK